MSTITFDTLKFSKTLENAGFSAAQAEALANAQQTALAEATDNALARRSDIAELGYELRLVKWMVGASIALATASVSMMAKIILGH